MWQHSAAAAACSQDGTGWPRSATTRATRAPPLQPKHALLEYGPRSIFNWCSISSTSGKETQSTNHPSHERDLSDDWWHEEEWQGKRATDICQGSRKVSSVMSLITKIRNLVIHVRGKAAVSSCVTFGVLGTTLHTSTLNTSLVFIRRSLSSIVPFN